VGSNPTLSASDGGDAVADEPNEIGRSVPRWASIAAAAGLIALVAMTSRPATTPGAGLDGGPHVALTVAEIIGYVALALGIVALITGLVISRAHRRERSAPRRRTDFEALPRRIQILALVVLGGLIAGQLAVVISYLAEVLRLAALRLRDGAVGGGSWLDTVLGPAAGQDLAALTIALVILLAIAIVVAVLAVLGRIRDDRLEGGAPAGHRAPAIEAVDLSIDALRAAGDPRRAVIAAYAAMEQSLSDAGFERRRSEAPFEYLRRVLAAPVAAADDLRTLTQLFQRARFSRHLVDESMRDQAIGALERIREEAQAVG
jgi:uncharacterized membrane protein